MCLCAQADVLVERHGYCLSFIEGDERCCLLICGHSDARTFANGPPELATERGGSGDDALDVATEWVTRFVPGACKVVTTR